MYYDTDESGNVGYSCGYTYLTGDRPEQSEVEQRSAALELAKPCCKNGAAIALFVEEYVHGYADRLTNNAKAQAAREKALKEEA